MKPVITRLITLALLFGGAQALARDYPAEVIKTGQDFFLIGQPKRVLTQVSQGDDNRILEDIFDKNGILVSHMVGGSEGSEPYVVKLKRGRLEEIRYSPSVGGVALTTTPLKLDDDGRVIALRDSSFTSSGEFISSHSLLSSNGNNPPTYVRMVRYEASRQIHDIYRDRKLLRSVAYTLNGDGILTGISCVAGDCGSFVDQQLAVTGPLVERSARAETTYRYEQGFVAETTTVHTGQNNVVEKRYYGNYLIDDCGNWVQQAIFDQPPSNPKRQRIGLRMREIEYHKACSPRPRRVTRQACPSGLTYRIGSIDPRFGLTPEQFRAAVDEAAALWNRQADKTLLTYHENGELPVNLVYDERQAEVVQLRGVSEAKAAVDSEYDALNAQYQAKSASIEPKRRQLNAEAARIKAIEDDLHKQNQVFGIDAEHYKARVKSINAAGGGTQDEVRTMRARQRQLEARQQELNSRHNNIKAEYARLNMETATFNALVDETNALGKRLNGYAAQARSLAKTYNSGKFVGREFEAGVFRMEGDLQWIDIYTVSGSGIEFEQDMKMRLAHEFGHALGFDHIEAPEAIMYYKSGSNGFRLEKADIDLLTTQCSLAKAQ